MSNVAISLIIAVVCFTGIALLARANHRAVIDPATGKPVKYWQPWRVWSIAIVLGLGVLYAASIIAVIHLE